MRASLITAMLFLVAVNPFPQELPSFSEVTNPQSSDDIEPNLEGQEMAIITDNGVASTDEHTETNDGSDQVDQLNQSPVKYTLPPDDQNSADSSHPIETPNEKNPLEASSKINIDSPPISGAPSALGGQGQKEGWIIEPGNGKNGETHPEIDPKTIQDRLSPPPTCLDWVIGCCDSWWLGEWKLGCSSCIFPDLHYDSILAKYSANVFFTDELNQGLRKCKVKDYIYCCKGIVVSSSCLEIKRQSILTCRYKSLLGYRCQLAYDGWGNPRRPRAQQHFSLPKPPTIFN